MTIESPAGRVREARPTERWTQGLQHGSAPGTRVGPSARQHAVCSRGHVRCPLVLSRRSFGQQQSTPTVHCRASGRRGCTESELHLPPRDQTCFIIPNFSQFQECAGRCWSQGHPGGRLRHPTEGQSRHMDRPGYPQSRRSPDHPQALHAARICRSLAAAVPGLPTARRLRPAQGAHLPGLLIGSGHRSEAQQFYS